MLDMRRTRETPGIGIWKIFMLAVCIAAGSLFIFYKYNNTAGKTQSKRMSSGFIFQRQRINGASEMYTLYRDADPVSYAVFLEQLSESPVFRDLFSRVLQSVEYPAFLFECPAISKDTLDKVTFAFVVTNSVSLARAEVDPFTFKSHFLTCEKHVTSFVSLGGDARLVVPCPVPEFHSAAYTHLAQFVRFAPLSQIDRLWQAVSAHMIFTLEKSDADVWLSTNGKGVSWLHIRLDSYPKYYSYRPFKHPTRDGF